MQLSDFFTTHANGTITVTPEQASDFAKSVAGDFNPIHNADAKRFCVPGDLLFTLVLNQFGLSEKMHIDFMGMVGKETPLHFNTETAEIFSIEDEDGKPYLKVEREGNTSQDQQQIKDLACQYVQFSGHTFPHVLVPLMRDKDAMINPDRPLVIYEEMAIDLDTLDFQDPKLSMSNSTLDVKGKRGTVILEFEITSNGTHIGHGKKRMVISGLRAFDEDKMTTLVDGYEALKNAYQSR